MACIRSAVLAGLVATSAAFAGPPGDYGDAPVGDNALNIQAYPGVLARWDTRYAHPNTVFNPQYPQGAWLNLSGAGCYLGSVSPATKFDSAMDPASPENDCAPAILIYTSPPNPGPNPLADVEVTVSTTALHDPERPVYLNLWIDQNRDGQWKDGFNVATPLIAWNMEWALQDVPVILPASTTARVNTGPIRLENPLASVWVRVMVTDEPIGAAFRGPAGSSSWFWDSTMTAAHAFHGEIEDHLLNFQTSSPAVPTPGIWYRQVHNAPGGGGGGPPAKPSCSLRYTGPWVVRPPRCPLMIVFPLGYRKDSECNNGCTGNDALWGMYGLLLVRGAGPAPTVTVAPLPPGAAAAAVFACVPPPVILALPANIVGEGVPAPNRMAGVTIPPAALTTAQLRLSACYGLPRRYRAYRSFFHVFTCGSWHVTRTVFGYPQTGVTLLSSSAIEAPGLSADYCDYETGGDEENFQDPENDRPFPDPDFTDYTFNLHSPTGSIAQLDPGLFVSAPTSLVLGNASYVVRPAFPTGQEAASVEMQHLGSATVVLQATDGQTLVATLPPSPGWELFSMSLPAGFRLDSIVVDTPALVHIDDLFVDFRPIPTPPLCPADADQNGVIQPADVAVFVTTWSVSLANGTLEGDFDGNGVVSPADVAAFVSAWFAALANGC